MKSSTSCDESIPAKEYLKREHFVYGWFRGMDYLYIGVTKRGKLRLTTHNVINRVEPVIETDEFHFWYPVKSELLELESWLISFHKPKYQLIENRLHKNYNYGNTGGHICSYCGKRRNPMRPFGNLCFSCHMNQIKAEQGITNFTFKEHSKFS